jgi:hypothetical protein
MLKRLLLYCLCWWDWRDAILLSAEPTPAPAAAATLANLYTTATAHQRQPIHRVYADDSISADALRTHHASGSDAAPSTALPVIGLPAIGETVDIQRASVTV